MRSLFKTILYLAAVIVTFHIDGFAASEILDYPGSTHTFIEGGYAINTPPGSARWTSKIVGWASESPDTNTSRKYGFLYSGSTYTSIIVPYSQYTKPYGINGNNIVGQYSISNALYGFLFNGSSFRQLAYPGGVMTAAYGVDGDYIVGEWRDGNYWYWYGFLYKISTASFTDIIRITPVHHNTFPRGINGSNVVGYYIGNDAKRHGFHAVISIDRVYSYTTLDVPGAKDTFALGINGDTIVGYYVDTSGKTHGFIRRGTTYSTFDYPGATDTFLHSKSGPYIMGNYKDSSGKIHGFVHDTSLRIQSIQRERLIRDSYPALPKVPR